MKLTTYRDRSAEYLGVVVQGKVVNLSAAFTGLENAGLAAGLPGAPCLQSMMALIRQGEAGFRLAEKITGWVTASGGRMNEFSTALDSVTIGPPLPSPGKIICIGLNYADHAREMEVAPPERPMVFCKFSTAVIGTGETITWPAEISQQVDFEAELAVVIGREARNVPAERALDVVAGYTIINDVSARDVQFADQQWVRGKSFDTFCPMGPFMVTADEVPTPHALAIRCLVNGQVMQDSNTSELIFKIPALIEFISRTCTLLPGDIISTGTPHGVGVFRKPQVFLKPGDEVVIEIDGLGQLRNPVG